MLYTGIFNNPVLLMQAEQVVAQISTCVNATDLPETLLRHRNGNCKIQLR
jgi:hypothetical protein